jgi:sugar lactone lactonase YvrE
MRRHILLTVGLAAVLAVGVAPATATTVTSGPAASTSVVAASQNLHPRVVTTFPAGTEGAFAESMAVDGRGTLYVSVTNWTKTGWSQGQVWKVAPNGTRTKFGPVIPCALLTGVAIDRAGRVYVGLVGGQGDGHGLVDLAPGVIRINADGTATRVLTLPNGPEGKASFPNGLAFRGDDLYVADSTGAIWRTHPHGRVNDTPKAPWLKATILAPSVGHLGVNGLAFRSGVLYAGVYDSGLIVKISLGRHGRAGTPVVFAKSTLLKDADGIMFDLNGTLWVTSTRSAVKGSGALLTVGRHGKVTVVAEHPTWLDYPTQAVFGRTSRDRSTLYITNGSFAVGTPNVTAIRFHTPWVHPT